MKKYYSSLDLYRFMAALAVAFFFHYRIVLGAVPFLDNAVVDFLSRYAGYVVELFFVISGFVLENAVSKKIQNEDLSVGSFIINRIKRMYPTLLITVLVAAIGMWLGYAIWDMPLIKDSSVSLFAFVLNMLGLNGGLIVESSFVSVNGPSWYISVLMVCSILYYAIAKMSKREKGLDYLCYIVIILIGMFVYTNVPNLPFLSVSCARGYIYFFIGVIWCCVQRHLHTKGNIIACIISLICVVLFLFTKYKGLLYNESLEIGLFVVVPCVVFGINFLPLNSICNNKIVRYLGGISFGIFMWNIPIFIWTRFIEELLGVEFAYDNMGVYLCVVIVNIVAGILSYMFIEGKLTNTLISNNRFTGKKDV